ncbi:MAG: xylose isomerase, partial [Planctomycetes bacterium RBG_16_64_10]
SLAAGDAAISRQSAPFRYCLNTGTIRGQELGIVKAIEIAAQAGYTGIEPWIRELDQYVEGGGALAELRQRIVDQGLTVEGAVAFAPWIADDAARRAQGLEEMKRAMATVRALGGSRLAAPPAGEDQQPVELAVIGQRYRELLELGRRMEVVPQLEVWGASRSLSRVSQAAYVAIESGHAQACLLLDVFHLYKGGSDFEGLRLISGQALHVLHLNDYPAEPGPAALNDSHRLFPGDGIAPLTRIVQNLYAGGFRGALSLELFNREYWRQDPLQVARTGLEKMIAVVQKSLAS